MKNKKAFTLIEITVVVIIIGVIASLALVQYTRVIERMRGREGAQVLLALFSAQKEYFRENGNYHKGDINDINAELDITIPTAQHFTSIVTHNNPSDPIVGKTLNVGACGTVPIIAEVERTSGDYNLYITTDGEIVCTISASKCNGICQKMGFPTTW